METPGKLLLVTGFYGAGKSTLTRAALGAIDSLEYLRTTTTRPPRPEEIAHGSIEYDFVTPEEYRARRLGSACWDHMELQGHSYGADVVAANKKFARGIGLICCTAPDIDVIDQMKGLFRAPTAIVWVDTPLEVANRRLLASNDGRRIQRINHHLQTEANATAVREIASVIFEPAFELEVDTATFIGTVNGILGQATTLPG